MDDFTLPLAGESALFNYLQGLVTGKTPNPAYTGVQVERPAPIQELTGDALQSIITEYLRGQGNLLGNLAQPKQAGLYNSNTQTLVANDIMTSAARKAALANTAIQESNAKITNDYVANLLKSQPKYIDTSNQRSSAAGGLAISGLRKLLGMGTSETGKKVASSGQSLLKQLFGGSDSSQNPFYVDDEEALKLLKKGGSSSQSLPDNMSVAPGGFPLASALDSIGQYSTPLGSASMAFDPSYSAGFGGSDMSAPISQFDFSGYDYIDASTFLSGLPSGSGSGSGSGGGGGSSLSDLLSGLIEMPVWGGSSGGSSGGGDYLGIGGSDQGFGVWF